MTDFKVGDLVERTVQLGIRIDKGERNVVVRIAGIERMPVGDKIVTTKGKHLTIIHVSAHRIEGQWDKSKAECSWDIVQAHQFIKDGVWLRKDGSKLVGRQFTAKDDGHKIVYSIGAEKDERFSLTWIDGSSTESVNAVRNKMESGIYTLVPDDSTQKKIKQPKLMENNMDMNTHITVVVPTKPFAKTTVTTLFGEDATTFNEESLFNTLTRIQKETATLENLDTKGTCKRVSAKIKQLVKASEEVIKLIDAIKD